MLRYLEPLSQTIVRGGIDKVLSEPEPFVGVYCPCKEGHINKTDLLLLDDPPAAILTEHLLNLTVADYLVNCLRTQFPDEFLPQRERETFAKNVSQLFDSASIASSIDQANQVANIKEDALHWLQSLFVAESRKVSDFLRRNSLMSGKAVYDGATSGYHDFLLPVMRHVQEFQKLKSVPIYILLDDADRLGGNQQSIVNSWIANRDQSLVCLKISAHRDGYKTFFTRDHGLIEQPHDYTEVDVDELYTTNRSDYSEKVRLITERRLELSIVPVKNIDEFLPADSGEIDLLEKIRADTTEEWERVGKPGRLRDYVYRYATARLFQHLKERRQQKSYAGFQNMVDLSSGIVRDFLEPCYLMFDKCVAQGSDPKTIKCIPPAVQDDVLFKYSEEFILQKFDDIRKGLPPEKWTHVEALATLVASLGQLFYERLQDPEAREARLFSFTVRGRVPSDIDEILRLGVVHRYFQVRTYSKKEGGGRERWYILNRRVCPVFKLDPTGFEGRISLTPDLLRLACQNPEKFVRLRLRQAPVSEQVSLFSLEEGEMK